MEPTLEQLEQALANIEGRTPLEVLDAFCPVGATVASMPLVPITAGHELFLSRMQHPLASRQTSSWAPHDVAVALFAFTRSSRELFQLVETGEFEDQLHAFLDGLPVGEIDGAAATLMAHWLRARSTALAMRNPNATGSKKKRVSAGSCR